MIFAWLFCTIFLSLPPSARATTPAPTVGFPICLRPLDFTLSKEVTAYEKCFSARAHFCEAHAKAAECVQLRRELYAIKVDKKVKDPNPEEKCLILKDGSYSCKQEPIKFLSLNPAAVAPEPATPTTPVSPGLTMPDMKAGGTNRGRSAMAPGGSAPSTAPNVGGTGVAQPTAAPYTGSDENNEAPPPADILGPMPKR